MSAIDDIDDYPNVDDYYQPLVENVINQNPVENQQQPESNVNDIDENLDDNDAQAQDIVNNRIMITLVKQLLLLSQLLPLLNQISCNQLLLIT